MSYLFDGQMVIDAVLRVAQTCPAEFENSGDARMGYIAAIQSIYHEFKAISPARPDPIYCRDCCNWEQINKALSARPEIIRCRKCKHWNDNDGFNHEHGAQCEVMNMWMQPGDYCSYAKRREEAERMKSRVTEIGEAILDLIKIYADLKEDPYTKNPVARALYFTWKKYDIDKKVNK